MSARTSTAAFRERLRDVTVPTQERHEHKIWAVETALLSRLLLSHFRYSLGRRTAMVSLCVADLTRFWSVLAPFHEQIHRDIRAALERRRRRR